MRATWNGVTLAESDDIVRVEGNAYFPLDALNMDYFQSSDHTSVCPWKGTANYFDVVVEGQTNANAAWIYRETKPKAEHVKGRVAFWKGVVVS